jgi:hypothetical protein
MTKCEFCHKSFTPRPQTNKARACEERECQNKRQRLNEKEWRIRNKDYYGAQYYADYRKDRLQLILKLVERFLKVLRIGCTALNENFSIDEFKKLLVPFFSRIGIRRANKLCPG